MHIKYERIHKAHELFDNVHDANIVLWYKKIIGYTQDGFYKKIPNKFYSRRKKID